MRPALILVLSAVLLSGCGLAGVRTPAPTAPPPRLVPLEDILVTPDPAATDEIGASLAARAGALRANAGQP